MFESVVTLIGLGVAFVIGFLLGCYLTLNSIRQDGIDINLEDNVWKVSEP